MREMKLRGNVIFFSDLCGCSDIFRLGFTFIYSSGGGGEVSRNALLSSSARCQRTGGSSTSWF